MHGAGPHRRDQGVLVDGARLALPAPLGGQANRPVTLGLRPEHLAAAGGGSGVPLDVLLVEMLGADTIAHGQMSSSGAPLTTRLHGTSKVAPGDRLQLVIEPRHLHLFDPLTARRLDV